MSGMMSLERYKALFPAQADGKSDEELRFSLAVVQSISEGISGLAFGSEIHHVEDISDPGEGIEDTWRLKYSGGIYVPGHRVRLLGGGAPSDPLLVVGVGGDGIDGWVDVETDVAEMSPVKMLPVEEWIGETRDFIVDVKPKPIYSVVSVRTRRSPGILFHETDRVTEIEPDDYSLVRNRGLGVGIRLRGSKVPFTIDRGERLIKQQVKRLHDSIQLMFAAGFGFETPADLESVVGQMMVEVGGIQQTGGAFSSERFDYYSYSRLSYDQMQKLPFTAVHILRQYANL